MSVFYKNIIYLIASYSSYRGKVALASVCKKWHRIIQPYIKLIRNCSKVCDPHELRQIFDFDRDRSSISNVRRINACLRCNYAITPLIYRLSKRERLRVNFRDLLSSKYKFAVMDLFNGSNYSEREVYNYILRIPAISDEELFRWDPNGVKCTLMFHCFKGELLVLNDLFLKAMILNNNFVEIIRFLPPCRFDMILCLDFAYKYKLKSYRILIELSDNPRLYKYTDHRIKFGRFMKIRNDMAADTLLPEFADLRNVTPEKYERYISRFTPLSAPDIVDIIKNALYNNSILAVYLIKKHKDLFLRRLEPYGQIYENKHLIPYVFAAGYTQYYVNYYIRRAANLDTFLEVVRPSHNDIYHGIVHGTISAKSIPILDAHGVDFSRVTRLSLSYDVIDDINAAVKVLKGGKIVNSPIYSSIVDIYM